MPTAHSWHSLNATLDHGARGGDELTVAGTGFTLTQQYVCHFEVSGAPYPCFAASAQVCRVAFLRVQVSKVVTTPATKNRPAVSTVVVYASMNSQPVYPQSGSILVCTTPAWGAKFMAQYAAVSLLIYPSLDAVPLINKHRSSSNTASSGLSTLEYHMNFYQVTSHFYASGICSFSDDVFFNPVKVAEAISQYPNQQIMGGSAAGGESLSIRAYGLNVQTLLGYICKFTDKRTGVEMTSPARAFPSSTQAISCISPSWGSLHPSANVTITLQATDQRRTINDVDIWSPLTVFNRQSHPRSLEYFFEPVFSLSASDLTGPAGGLTSLLVRGYGFDPTKAYTFLFEDSHGNKLASKPAWVPDTTRMNITTPGWGNIFSVDQSGTKLTLYEDRLPIQSLHGPLYFKVRFNLFP